MSGGAAGCYADDGAIAQLVDAFLSHSLPKAQWTHGAHFATALWLLMRRPDVHPEGDMPAMIRSYNLSVGGVNSASAGYHETITQASIAACRAHITSCDPASPPYLVHAALMAGPCGDKDWLLAYWSRPRLMSAEARAQWVAPDSAPLPFAI